jgi:hypothetical protein
MPAGRGGRASQRKVRPAFHRSVWASIQWSPTLQPRNRRGVAPASAPTPRPPEPTPPASERTGPHPDVPGSGRRLLLRPRDEPGLLRIAGHRQVEEHLPPAVGGVLDRSQRTRVAVLPLHEPEHGAQAGLGETPPAAVGHHPQRTGHHREVVRGQNLRLLDHRSVRGLPRAPLTRFAGPLLAQLIELETSWHPSATGPARGAGSRRRARPGVVVRTACSSVHCGCYRGLSIPAAQYDPPRNNHLDRCGIMDA